MEQQTMNIDAIRVTGNPRTDFGDLTELTASIRELGVLEPLLITASGELVAGERRLRAAEAAGKKEVPVRVIEVRKDERAAVALVENLHRKELSQVEEGEAYAAYLQAHPHTTAWLAQKIGKTKAYVERRLRYVQLVPEARTALVEGCIKPGHADLVAQLGPTEQRRVVKNIQQHRMTVQEFRDALAFTDLDFDELPPAVQRGQQSLLGHVKDVVDRARDADMTDALKARLARYLARERQKLREKGIKVWAREEQLVKQHPHAAAINEWYDNKVPVTYDGAVKALPHSEEFGLVVEWDGWLTKTVYALDLPALKQRCAEEQRNASTPQEREANAQLLNQTREERLQSRLQNYLRGWMIDQAGKTLKPGSNQAKALAIACIRTAITRHGQDERVTAVEEALNLPAWGEFKEYATLTEEQLDTALARFAALWIGENPGETFRDGMKLAGVRIEQFRLDEEFLRLHTKEQLRSLAREVKVTLTGEKKAELVADILNAQSKQVPQLAREAAKRVS